MRNYAELQVSSNFSFLRGASHPHELVMAAHEYGHHAIALTIAIRYPELCWRIPR